MASVPLRNAISLAQSMDPANLDGAVTLEEAIGQTDGMKLLQLEKPIAVNKPLGAVRVGDLPAKDDVSDTLKRKTISLTSSWVTRGNNQTPYNMQLILPQGSNVYHIVKYIKFTENTKVNHQTILNMCSGRACEIDLQKHFREGSRGLQYMLEGLGGFQVRYFKLIPAGSSNKVPKETDDIRKGLEHIRKFGPPENANGEFTSWTEEEVNNPTSPLHKWDRGTIKEFLRPSFHKDFDEEDLMGIFKRSVFVVVTDIGIYLRLPGTDRDPHADDLQWSLNLLQAALDGEDVPLCYTIKGREFSTGRKNSKEVRPDLAGISGTTIHYFEETSASSKAPPAKRLKSVRSSNSLLHIPDENGIGKDTEEIKHEDSNNKLEDSSVF
eukprot:s4547_g6.t1